MTVYTHFILKLIRNYVLGSMIAVLGVGGIFLKSTLSIDHTSLLFMLISIMASLPIMLSAEYIFFNKHMKPLKRAFSEDAQPNHIPLLSTIQEAYLRTHHLPLLAVYRTMGPHLFGLIIPCTIFMLTFINLGWLTSTLSFFFYNMFAAVMVAVMHALIEFFFTTAAVAPVLLKLKEMAKHRYKTDLSLGGKVVVSVRKKYLWSAFIIGIFPILLTMLTLILRFSLEQSNLLESFWIWILLIVVIGITFSTMGAWLLSKDIERPILQLEQAMKQVEAGDFNIHTDEAYSDEFSKLMSGFNHMVQGLRIREQQNKQLLSNYFSILAAALDARDPYTAGHSERVATYSLQIGKLLQLDESVLDLLYKSALLHDIGKIGVRDHILLKDGKLTDDEYEQIQLHPVRGELILQQIEPKEIMEPLLPGVRSHHEHYNGKGYPDQLAGEEIPLFGRIMAIADAYDAMTSDRPYRQGMPKSKALSIIAAGKGTQWDPRIASLFLNDMGFIGERESHPHSH